MRILLIGPPGVGKGTQAELLGERFGIAHIASGDIFRAELQGNTTLGRIAKEYMERGELVPDQVTIDMMAKRILSPAARDNGFVLDGFPRTVAQAEALDLLLTSLDMALDRVVVLNVPDDVVHERLGGRLSCSRCGAAYHLKFNPPKREGECDRCGGELAVRKDDEPETIRERLRVYRASTAPVVAHYERQGKVVRLDGGLSREDVLNSILDAIPK